MIIEELLTETIKNNASDLHISPQLPPIFRIDGNIKKSHFPILSSNDTKEILFSLMSKTQQNFFEKNLEIDFSYNLKELARFRVNIFYTKNGISGVLRLIPNDIKTLDQLNTPPIFKRFCQAPRGLVLITGPTGSGKSTTLSAMINFINENLSQHIITIEDPIEFIHKSKKSLINQRELNHDTLSFSNALRSALREDPDVILVGEMRDIETIRLALTAAETGHLVFATLHTTGAAKTVDRIVDAFPVGEKEMIRTMLSESLLSVVSQTLLKKTNSPGRVAAYEIMVTTPAIKNLIRENKVAQMNATIQTGQQHGMQTLNQALSQLVNLGIISKDIAKNKATDFFTF